MAVYACNTSRIVTAWKVPHTVQQQYDKIMVAGVYQEGNDSIRMLTEDAFVKGTEGLDYRAVPAYSEFGLKGLSGLGQAETYFKLCQNGIDAVMTIALIDGAKATFQKAGDMYEYPASHYYSRIWNYKNISASPQGTDSDTAIRFWEIILFDLNTLEATCVLQTKSFANNINSAVIQEFARQAIRKLHKEKVLAKGNRDAGPLKAF